MKLIEAEQEERYQVEPLEELVHSYIDNECIADDQDGAHNIRRAWVPRKEALDTFLTHNFCEDVLLRSSEQVRRPDLNIIGQAMTRIGWTKGKLWNARISKTSTGWKRPDTENRPHPPSKSTSPSEKIAAKRELEEETGIKTTTLIREIDEWLTYNLPKNLLGKIWKGKYRGQKQKWFVMKFTGSESEININTKNPEFLDWKWIDPNDLPNVAVNFKIKIYKRIAKELTLKN